MLPTEPFCLNCAIVQRAKKHGDVAQRIYQGDPLLQIGVPIQVRRGYSIASLLGTARGSSGQLGTCCVAGWASQEGRYCKIKIGGKKQWNCVTHYGEAVAEGRHKPRVRGGLQSSGLWAPVDGGGVTTNSGGPLLGIHCFRPTARRSPTLAVRVDSCRLGAALPAARGG